MTAAQNVTPIGMLPDLEDLEKGQGGHNDMLPPGHVEKYGKFIRKSHNTPHEAGMRPYNTHRGHMHSGHEGQVIQPEQDRVGISDSLRDTPSCIDVAEHISMCPICSKFYNNDKTIYIIAIIILAIVCILLLKKVLEI